MKCGKTGKLYVFANTVNDDIVEIPHANSGNSGNSEIVENTEISGK